MRPSQGRPHCVIWRLKETKEDVVDPKVIDFVIADTVCPEAEHAIEGNEDAEEVGHHEHALRGSVTISRACGT